MSGEYVAIRSKATGSLLYHTQEWLLWRSERSALPCKSIEYIDMSLCGMESFYKVVFKVNEYTYEEHLPCNAYTSISIISKEEY